MKSPLSRFAVAAGTAVTLTLGLSACIALPPAAVPAPVAPAASSTPESSSPETSAPSSPTTPTTSGAVTPTNPQTYSVTGDDSTFSFTPVSAEILAADSYGSTAEPGHNIVLFTMDVAIESGDGDFLWAGELLLIDDATGTEYGTSTGTSFIATNDYYFAPNGAGPGVEAILHVPQSVDITHWMFVPYDGTPIDIVMH